MTQQEIQFFWPLTEQVPLDLNYEDCNKPRLTYPLDNTVNTGQFYFIPTTGTYNTTITASNLSIDVDTTTIKLKEKPNLCRRTLLKCLGLKWEKK
jgi:hypothetical protein